MDPFWKTTLWNQFGAAVDSLEAAIRACPDEVWGDRVDWWEFWYLASHTLFWLDYYLSDDPAQFAPPAPFGLEEVDPAGVLPPRVYTKAELLAYLEYGRAKARAKIASLTEVRAREHFDNGWIDLPVLEMILYSLRHVQHHTAQLNLLLRQRTDSAPKWVRQAKSPLGN